MKKQVQLDDTFIPLKDMPSYYYSLGFRAGIDFVINSSVFTDFEDRVKALRETMDIFKETEVKLT